MNLCVVEDERKVLSLVESVAGHFSLEKRLACLSQLNGDALVLFSVKNSRRELFCRFGGVPFTLSPYALNVGRALSGPVLAVHLSGASTNSGQSIILDVVLDSIHSCGFVSWIVFVFQQPAKI